MPLFFQIPFYVSALMLVILIFRKDAGHGW